MILDYEVGENCDVLIACLGLSFGKWLLRGKLASETRQQPQTLPNAENAYPTQPVCLHHSSSRKSSR